jgi:hypothetical protein
MPNITLPAKASKDVILIDGICYKLVGPKPGTNPSHQMSDIDGQFDTCEQCAEAEKSDLSSSSSQSAAETKTIFGIEWTNGDPKLIDGTYTRNVGTNEIWRAPFTGNNKLTFFHEVLGASELYGTFQIRGTGGDFNNFRIWLSNSQSQNNTNIATQWKSVPWPSTVTTIPASIWGTAGSPGKITTNDGLTVEWWRSGNDTIMKCSW